MSDNELSAKKREAIAALLSSRNIAEAARIVNVSERTLHRWLKDKHFVSVLRRERNVLYSQTIIRLEQMGPPAISMLGKNMMDRDAGRPTPSKNAYSILSLLLRTRDREDIERRFAELEAAVEDLKGKR